MLQTRRFRLRSLSGTFTTLLARQRLEIQNRGGNFCATHPPCATPHVTLPPHFILLHNAADHAPLSWPPPFSQRCPLCPVPTALCSMLHEPARYLAQPVVYAPHRMHPICLLLHCGPARTIIVVFDDCRRVPLITYVLGLSN